MKLPNIYYTLKPNLVFCIGLPLFLMLFMILYRPGFGLEESEGMRQWTEHVGFCLPVVCAIVMGVLMASRAIICFLMVRHTLTKREYGLWQAAEFGVACLFVDLFLSLYLHINYFDLLPRIMLLGLGVLIFPYLFFWLVMGCIDRDQRLSDATLEAEQLRKGIERTEQGVIRFADEKGVVKLVVGAERIISLESAGNYVTILYNDDGKLVRYSLRNTLKGIEDNCAAMAISELRSYLYEGNITNSGVLTAKRWTFREWRIYRCRKPMLRNCCGYLATKSLRWIVSLRAQGAGCQRSTKTIKRTHFE